MKIDLSNPKVLGNYLRGLAKANQGDIYIKEKVYAFKDHVGNEFIVPTELVQELLKSSEAKAHKEADGGPAVVIDYDQFKTESGLYSHPEIGEGKEYKLNYFKGALNKLNK